ncbi:hypothetical protein CCR75_000537 [Bremia lactucae]|uniref:Uncharacterized protein n=1 Tax=Bremia lactucae TaxID=4779 RepID=A0A976NZ15_BRELC|nr:hypothetical protein CCR75_000537 [Bremia lactucae]
MDELDPIFVRVPNSSKGKGLEAGFMQWGQLLLVKIDLAERANILSNGSPKGKMKAGHGMATFFLVALQEAPKSCEELIVENIAKYGQPESQALIIEQYNWYRTDFLAHAEEKKVTFIEGMKDEIIRDRQTGRELEAL